MLNYFMTHYLYIGDVVCGCVYGKVQSETILANRTEQIYAMVRYLIEIRRHVPVAIVLATTYSPTD